MRWETDLQKELDRIESEEGELQPYPTENESGTRVRGDRAPRSKSVDVDKLTQRINGIISRPTRKGNESESPTTTGSITREPRGERSIGRKPQNNAQSETKGEKSVQKQTQIEKQKSETGITHGEILEIPPEDSTEQSKTAFVAISQSTNYLSDSVKQLNELMRSAGKSQKNQSPTFEQIKAVCECGKTMAGLIRLQVDLFREVRKASLL